MSTIQLEREDVSLNREKPPPMWHIEKYNGSTHALCGQKFNLPDPAEPVDVRLVDCVVCAELWRNL